MPTNEYVPFGLGVGSNTLSPAAWAALTARQSGFAAGVASSAQINTGLRQSSAIATMLAQFTADNQGSNVLDDGNLSNLETQFGTALVGFLTGKFQKIQAPITYTGQTLLVGQLYEQDISGGTPIFTLPNPATITPGWYVDHIANNLPTGYQTAYTQIAAGVGSVNLTYRQVSHAPFYLIGQGEGFRYFWDGTKFLILTIGQTANPLLRLSQSSGSTITGTGANALIATNTAGGNTSPFTTATGTINLPVSGTWWIATATTFTSGSASWQLGTLSVGNGVGLGQVYDTRQISVSNLYNVQVAFNFLQYFGQGSAVCSVQNTTASAAYLTAGDALTAVLIVR